MAKRDYYEVIGVARTATKDEIKKAYRKVAMKYHPDRNPGNPETEELFKEAAEAYEVLGDDEKRQRYDRFGHEGLKSTFGNGGFQWSDFHHASEMEDVFGGLFSAFFGGGNPFGGGGGRGGPRGRDIRIRYPLTLEEAFAGKAAKVTFERREPCETCGGTGAAPGSSPERCSRCGGSGAVRLSRGFFSVQTTCEACGGAGTVITKPCPDCGGEALIGKKVEVSFDIPPGVDDGMSLRLRGEGEAAQGSGSTRGDLYVGFQVREHDVFTREGTNIILEMPISFTQSALGAELTVPTLHGDQTVQIPPGTQSHTVFRLRGKGMPAGDGSYGDQYLRTVVVTPRKLNDRQRELLRELAAESKEDYHAYRKKSFFQKLRDTILDVGG
ncbi:MAG: molecular chaperone DnaJ [Candidatus Sumerlaeota bacterium]|nr:molecular chaperone DnaJ [Candidatus Sumerlaeota bacterium]